jgi:hypothetical protein
MKSKLTIGPKTKYLCLDGPLAGKTLTLSTPNTLPFTLNGVTGRYKGGIMEGTASRSAQHGLLWES